MPILPLLLRETVWSSWATRGGARDDAEMPIRVRILGTGTIFAMKPIWREIHVYFLAKQAYTISVFFFFWLFFSLYWLAFEMID